MTIHAYISELFCLQTGGKKKKNMMAREEVERMLFYNTPPGGNLYIITFDFRRNIVFDVVG